MDKHLFYIAFSLFIGMVFSYYIKIQITIILISILLISCLLFINRKSKNRFIFFIVLVFFIGMADYGWFSSFESKFSNYENMHIEIEMIILDDGVKKYDYTLYHAETTGLIDRDKFYNYKEKILFKNYGDNEYKTGDVVRAEGKAIGFIGKRNFGDKDYKLYNKSIGIYNQFISANNKKVKKSKDLKTVIFLETRKKLQKVIDSSLPQEEAAFLNAIVLGYKKDMSEEDLNDFKKTGLAHILSVSGLHVSFIALLLYKLLSFLKMDKKTISLTSGFILIYYVMIIGSPPPAVRAMLMTFVVYYGKAHKKEYDLIASVSFAAIIMLLTNPMLIHNGGFIISYICIYSIAFIYEPVYEKIKHIPFPSIINKSIALSIAVQAGIAPLLIHYYQYLPIINILINIMAVPITFAIIAIAFPGILIGIIFPAISIYVLSADYYMISFLLRIIKISGSLTFSGVHIPALPILAYIAYYLFLICIINYKSSLGYYVWKWRFQIYAASALLIFAISIKYVVNDDLRIVVLDVGQGDSILITTPKGKNVLIDGGGSYNEGDNYDVGSKITVPALRKLGVWNIDTIILSHIHGDHLEGLIRVAEEFNVNNVVLPETPYKSKDLNELIYISKEKDSNIFYVDENDKLTLERDIFIEVLHPPNELLKGTNSDENNNSVVAKLNYRKFSMIFTGDIEREAEKELINKDIQAIVLKVPHHGSSTSSSEEFLKKVSPKVSIISVGNNIYGHPSTETINNIKEVGSAIYRTDKNGAIKIITDGFKLKVTSVR